MRIGIDLGGTKTEAIVLDDDGQERARRRIDSPQGSYDDTVRAIAELVSAMRDEAGAQGDDTVGVGIPGAISPKTGLVKNANSTWLIGHALDKDLENAIRLPVRLANDANCFAVSEATDGAGRGHRVVFGVILGTGVGGGIAIDGQAHTGINAIAGEWGHNPLPWPQDIDGSSETSGPACYCGKRGCIETFLSGPGLSDDFVGAGGEEANAREIVALATLGNPLAAAAIARYTDRLARAVAGVINILDPDVVVFGGGLSNLDEIYDALPNALEQYVFSDACDTPCVKNKHGDSSGVRGAAWLWPK
ncbi:MAG: ROK family protein [Rhodospirillales bacterium]|nr:ROK family protein [Rhodospirillales bacterium]MBO6786334.1 ROK family protein [Rhodospirillales bacterium]